LKFSQQLPGALALYAAAFWWGSLTAIGFVAVPLLFAHMLTPGVAGTMAARLFSAQTWIALGCGLLLIVISRGRGSEAKIDWADGALMFIAAGMLLALLAEFAVAPRILARQDLALWHSIGSGMYVLQWACAGITLWRVRCAGPS
jgi:hypothetical protein